MRHTFQIDLKLDGKLVTVSKLFTTTGQFINECYELAKVLEDEEWDECEVVLYVNDEYENSAFFDNQKNYSKNFCSLMAQIFYVCDLCVYID